jgi:hypothetical protein
MAKVKKYKEFKKLADDILLFKNDEGEWEKAKEPMELIQITGQLTDEEEIEKIEENFTTDIETQIHGEIKRGEIIWLTALLQRKGSQSYNVPNTTGVLKCRIVDIYYGLNKLKQVMDEKARKKK